MRRAFALLCVCALAAATSTSGAFAQDAGDAGDVAPDVAPPERPEVKARVAVVVIGEGGASLPVSTRATLQVSMERALEDDHRLEIVDQDLELAQRGGKVPTDAVSEARGLLTAGEELLRRGQVAPALTKLEEASSHLAEVLAWTKKEELARAQFLLAAAHAMAGDDKQAIAGFVSLLAWRPEYSADPEISPKAVLPLWDKATAKVKKLAGGSIDVSSTPDGAMAYVDGRFVGFTPTTVEGLPAATHYVTVKLQGHIRTVSAVKVSDRHPAQLAVTLDPTPGADDLTAAVGELGDGVGKAQTPAATQAAFGDLGDLLDVTQAVVVVAPKSGDVYRGYVYAIDRSKELAMAEVTLGERDPSEAFGELAKALYDQVSFEPPKPPPPPPLVVPKRPPVWHHWWFWTTVGTAALVGVAVPLWLGRDTTPPVECPAGTSCGLVVLTF